MSLSVTPFSFPPSLEREREGERDREIEGERDRKTERDQQTYRKTVRGEREEERE